MKGTHHVIVETGRLRYEFDIKRNITIIQGDSATGKTTLIGLLRDYAEYADKTGVRITSDVECRVFGGGLSAWDIEITSCQNSIVFIDEGHSFIYTEEFARVIRETDNYYVLITRRPIRNLPYSINEIYGIRNSGRYNYPEKIYHEFYQLYKDINGEESNKADYLVVEDSNSGYQFYEKVLSETKCVSAGGNTKVYRQVHDLGREGVISVIIDGAAYGAYIEELLLLAERMGNVVIYLPESFEWMILKSGIFEFENKKIILENPQDYIESKEFFSWEQYFTSKLTQITGGTVYEYHKTKLSAYYIEGRNSERILAVIPKAMRRMLK